MIIRNELKKYCDKNIHEICKTDIIKRKSDNCFYEVKDVSFDKQEIAHYHFFGFTIKGIRNLQYHFENENNKFNIFLEDKL